MKEVEVKILDIDKKDFIKKLNKFGAKKIFSGKVKTCVYDYRDSSLRENGCFVRLRQQGDKAILSFKKKLNKSDAKSMEEIEVEVEDFKTAESILLNMGLFQFGGVIKTRESYIIGDVHFDFDKLDGIPEFLEIESDSEKKIFDYAKKLGIRKEDCRPWGMKQVFEYYNFEPDKRKKVPKK